jgi:hypothetical protein
MARRVLLLVTLVVVLIAVPTASGRLTTHPVPTGGFSIALPSTWVDLSQATPALLKQLEKAPSFRAFAQAASTNGALKLIAVDPAAKGEVYMSVGAARVGPVTLDQVATVSASELKKTLGSKSSVSMTKVQLAAGPAYRLHVAKNGAPNQTDEYVLLRDQVEYGIAFVAPSSSWTKREASFTSSARTFRFLQGPDLTHVVLAGTQVGKGYKLSAFPFGTSFIGEATLDLCAAQYPSEALRTGRLQVRYLHKGKGVDVSNEVVRYVSGGAQQALGEVSAVARACAKTPSVLKQGTTKEVYKVSPLKDPKLPAGTVAVRLEISVTKGKQTQTQVGIAIYMVKGDTLSGVYTFVAKGTTYADAKRIAFHAAEQSAHNLGAKSGSSGFTA